MDDVRSKPPAREEPLRWLPAEQESGAMIDGGAGGAALVRLVAFDLYRYLPAIVAIGRLNRTVYDYEMIVSQIAYQPTYLPL